MPHKINKTGNKATRYAFYEHGRFLLSDRFGKFFLGPAVIDGIREDILDLIQHLCIVLCDHQLFEILLKGIKKLEHTSHTVPGDTQDIDRILCLAGFPQRRDSFVLNPVLQIRYILIMSIKGPAAHIRKLYDLVNSDPAVTLPEQQLKIRVLDSVFSPCHITSFFHTYYLTIN